MLKTPEDAASDAWGVLRGIPSGDLGIRFEYDSVNDEATGYIYFNDGVNTPTKLKILTPADIPSSTGVISINGMAGVVSLTGNDIPMAGNDARTVKTAVYANESNIGVLADDIADEYSNSATYAVGDYVIHDNALYKCNTAITTAEAWTAAHWTAVALADEVQTNTQAIASTAADLAQLAAEVGIVVTGDTAAVNVSEGQYVIVQDSTITGITDGLYKAAANVSAGTPFVSANLTAVSGGLGAEVTSLSDQIGTKWEKTLGTGINSFSSLRFGFDTTDNSLLIDGMFPGGEIRRLKFFSAGVIKYEYYNGSSWTTLAQWSNS